MHQQFYLLATLFAANVIALPLNINLGAYSPALVVGDGEISFGGKEDVSNLMNALEGAAVSSAAANGAAAPAIVVPAPAESSASEAAPEAASANQSKQITAIQGLGKEIAPRITPFTKISKEKRDINGFNAALKYAADALKTSPKVQLGTGAEGSGVGIIQDAGISAPAAVAAGEKEKRDLAAAEKNLRTTVTTVFVRGGPAPAEAVSEARSLEDSAPVEKRAPSPGLDGVNLNMAEGQVAELTFVETRAVGENDNDE